MGLWKVRPLIGEANVCCLTVPEHRTPGSIPTPYTWIHPHTMYLDPSADYEQFTGGREYAWNVLSVFVSILFVLAVFGLVIISQNLILAVISDAYCNSQVSLNMPSEAVRQSLPELAELMYILAPIQYAH